MTHNQQLINTVLAASIHEIKNRYGLMFSQLDELLAALPLDETSQHQAAHIKSEADFIGNELVRVLTSYKLLEDQQAYVQNQQFLVDFLEEKVARHCNTIQAHNVAIEFECDEELDAFFDANVINIILDTAIYNAIKAGAKHILICAELKQNPFTIDVHDDGPGFPESMLEQPIQSQSINYDQGNTGLGLRLADQMIQQHQESGQSGWLQLLRSDRLGGACLRLNLPQ